MKDKYDQQHLQPEETNSTLPKNVIRIDEGMIRDHLDQVVTKSVEQTLNALLDAEADRLCGAQRYERSDQRTDTRAGSYKRQLHTKAGEVTLKISFRRSVRLYEIQAACLVNAWENKP